MAQKKAQQMPRPDAELCGEAGDGVLVEKARLDLVRLTQKSASMAEILSSVIGRVIEIKKRVGDHVNRNDVVATVERTCRLFFDLAAFAVATSPRG